MDPEDESNQEGDANSKRGYQQNWPEAQRLNLSRITRPSRHSAKDDAEHDAEANET